MNKGSFTQITAQFSLYMKNPRVSRRRCHVCPKTFGLFKYFVALACTLALCVMIFLKNFGGSPNRYEKYWDNKNIVVVHVLEMFRHNRSLLVLKAYLFVAAYIISSETPNIDMCTVGHKI